MFQHTHTPFDVGGLAEEASGRRGRFCRDLNEEGEEGEGEDEEAGAEAEAGPHGKFLGWVFVPPRGGRKAKAPGEKELGVVLWGQPRRPVKQGFGERCWRPGGRERRGQLLAGTGGVWSGAGALLSGHLHSEVPMGHSSGQFDEHVWGSGKGSHPETRHLEPSAGRWSLR